jgi:hypothetical protein
LRSDHQPRRLPAKVYQRSAGCRLEIELAGIGQRWRKMERATGIEPMGKALPELENKRFRANADAKCD